MVTQTQTTIPANEPQSEPTLTYQPNVDICDLGAEVLLVADIPGAHAAGIDVTFEDGVLALRAAVSPRELPGRAVRQEYGIGNYRRSFRRLADLGPLQEGGAHDPRAAAGRRAAPQGGGENGLTPRPRRLFVVCVFFHVFA